MDWSDPEFWLDGLGAAVASGIVAALTALLVVRLTAAHDRRLQLEAEVRAQAIRVMALGKEISTITTTLAPKLRWAGRGLDRRRQTAMIEFQVAAFTLEAILVPVDVELAKRLQDVSSTATDINPEWVRTVVNVVSAVYGVRLTNPGQG